MELCEEVPLTEAFILQFDRNTKGHRLPIDEKAIDIGQL